VLGRLPFQAAVKAALALRGVAVRSDVRAPLRPLSAEATARLQAELGALIELAPAHSGQV
jgi:dihydrodipicolinate synthase/N-acetylneuraminate lyase